MPCHAVICCVVSCHAVPCNAAACSATPRHAMRCGAVRCETAASKSAARGWYKPASRLAWTPYLPPPPVRPRSPLHPPPHAHTPAESALRRSVHERLLREMIGGVPGGAGIGGSAGKWKVLVLDATTTRWV
eukprot:355680-Chlamydomonas_euryale.AAC.5